MSRKTRVTINFKEYDISCIFAMEKKFPNDDNLGIALKVVVWSVSENRYLKWNEIKGTYLSEKIADWCENSINGQNSFYWDCTKEVK